MDLICLKWENYSLSHLNRLSELRTKQLYCDVTIVCQNEYYPAHKVVLSACSKFFDELFQKTQCQHPFIIIKDVTTTDFDALLDYMYKGTVNIFQNMLPGLMKAAEILQIKGLSISEHQQFSLPMKCTSICKSSTSSQTFNTKHQKRSTTTPLSCVVEKRRKIKNTKTPCLKSIDSKMFKVPTINKQNVALRENDDLLASIKLSTFYNLNAKVLFNPSSEHMSNFHESMEPVTDNYQNNVKKFSTAIQFETNKLPLVHNSLAPKNCLQPSLNYNNESHQNNLVSDATYNSQCSLNKKKSGSSQILPDSNSTQNPDMLFAEAKDVLKDVNSTQNLEMSLADAKKVTENNINSSPDLDLSTLEGSANSILRNKHISPLIQAVNDDDDNINTKYSPPVENNVNIASSSPVEDDINTQSSSPVEDGINTQSSPCNEDDVNTQSSSPVEVDINTQSSSPIKDGISTQSSPCIEEDVNTQSSPPFENDINTQSSPLVEDDINAQSSPPVKCDVNAQSFPPVEEDINAQSSPPIEGYVNAHSSPPVEDNVNTQSSSPVKDDVNAQSFPPVEEDVNAQSSPIEGYVNSQSSPPVEDNINTQSSSPVKDDVNAKNFPPIKYANIVPKEMNNMHLQNLFVVNNQTSSSNLNSEVCGSNEEEKFTPTILPKFEDVTIGEEMIVEENLVGVPCDLKLEVKEELVPDEEFKRERSTDEGNGFLAPYSSRCMSSDFQKVPDMDVEVDNSLKLKHNINTEYISEEKDEAENDYELEKDKDYLPVTVFEPQKVQDVDFDYSLLKTHNINSEKVIEGNAGKNVMVEMGKAELQKMFLKTKQKRVFSRETLTDKKTHNSFKLRPCCVSLERLSSLSDSMKQKNVKSASGSFLKGTNSCKEQVVIRKYFNKRKLTQSSLRGGTLTANKSKKLHTPEKLHKAQDCDPTIFDSPGNVHEEQECDKLIFRSPYIAHRAQKCSPHNFHSPDNNCHEQQPESKIIHSHNVFKEPQSEPKIYRLLGNVCNEKNCEPKFSLNDVCKARESKRLLFHYQNTPIEVQNEFPTLVNVHISKNSEPLILLPPDVPAVKEPKSQTSSDVVSTEEIPNKAWVRFLHKTLNAP